MGDFHHLRDFRYRLTADTAAIATLNGKLRKVTIHAKSTITVVDAPFNGARLVDISWEGKALMMSTADLKEHGELVDHEKMGISA